MNKSSPRLMERIVWIDIAKGIGVFLVIIAHTALYPQLNEWIGSFHMPLFVFLSEIMYKEKNIKQKICGRTKGLIIPYFSYPCAIAGLLFICTVSMYLAKVRFVSQVLCYIGKNTIVFYPVTAWMPHYIECICEDIFAYPVKEYEKIAFKILGFFVAAFVVEIKNRCFRRTLHGQRKNFSFSICL